MAAVGRGASSVILPALVAASAVARCCCSAAPAAAAAAAAAPAYRMDLVRNYTGLEHAAFAYLSQEVIPGSLLLTRFGAAPFLGKSQISLVNLSTGAKEDLTTGIDWPNEAMIVSESVFGFKAAVVGAGFLVPTHTNGGVWVVELSSQPSVLKSGPVKITADRKGGGFDQGWFYHRGQLVDMNNDGLLDVVTARCQFSVEPWNPKVGELVWLEQPSQGALNGTAWVEHTMQAGPDFLFAVAPRSVSGEGDELGLCASEYIGKRLTYVHGSDGQGFATRVVDASFGPGFDCRWADINGDGKLDLLATNHMSENGSVFAYTWEGDLADENTVVERHTLASGFTPFKKTQGHASPGTAIPFFPKVEPLPEDGRKPLILVSADNANYICILVPDAPEDPNNWGYSTQMLEFIGADVGNPTIGDTDGDGYNEIFAPAYDLGQVVQFKVTKADIQSEVTTRGILV